MVVICPTITTSTPHGFRDQMELAAKLSKRVHVDFADGILAPTKLVAFEQAWWPEGAIADFHVMYQKPLNYLETIVSLKPNLVIIHAEADEAAECLKQLKDFGLKVGIALLPQTPVETVHALLEQSEHVLVFGGHLGFQGAEADLSQLQKVEHLVQAYPGLEIGWDGGVNNENIKKIIEAGAQIINVGGYIQKASDPEEAYATLEQIITRG